MIDNTTFEIEDNGRRLKFQFHFSLCLKYVDVELSDKYDTYRCSVDADSGVTVWEFNDTVSVGVG
jgi:hypothetical protein